MYHTFSVLREVPDHPCKSSPCGSNAICRERNGAGSCVCVDDFYGDPYVGCRPECVMNTDCDRHQSCFNNKCVDPCSGTCGQNTECKVANHVPSCYCLPGYTGNSLHACVPVLSKISFLIFFYTTFIYFSEFFTYFSSLLYVKLSRDLWILAILHLADHTANVGPLTVTLFAHVLTYASVRPRIVTRNV